MRHDFLADLKTFPLFAPPTPEIVSALLLRACFLREEEWSPPLGPFRICVRRQVLRPAHLTEWTQLCGTLRPLQALPVSGWVGERVYT